MKKLFLLLFIYIGLVSSCDKDYGVLNSDNRADVPVTFPNATTYGFNPYIQYSLSSGKNIEIVLEIPETTGKKIKEITKVAAGATSINAGSLTASTYITSPINVNATRFTFTTSLEDFKTKTGLGSATIKAGGEVAFMFLITLDDGSTIIPVQLRVRLTQ